MCINLLFNILCLKNIKAYIISSCMFKVNDDNAWWIDAGVRTEKEVGPS